MWERARDTYYIPRRVVGRCCSASLTTIWIPAPTPILPRMCDISYRSLLLPPNWVVRPSSKTFYFANVKGLRKRAVFQPIGFFHWRDKFVVWSGFGSGFSSINGCRRRSRRLSRSRFSLRCCWYVFITVSKWNTFRWRRVCARHYLRHRLLKHLHARRRNKTEKKTQDRKKLMLSLPMFVFFNVFLALLEVSLNVSWYFWNFFLFLILFFSVVLWETVWWTKCTPIQDEYGYRVRSTQLHSWRVDQVDWRLEAWRTRGNFFYYFFPFSCFLHIWLTSF